MQDEGSPQPPGYKNAAFQLPTWWGVGLLHNPSLGREQEQEGQEWGGPPEPAVLRRDDNVQPSPTYPICSLFPFPFFSLSLSLSFFRDGVKYTGQAGLEASSMA